jgi:hypothetical protein
MEVKMNKEILNIDLGFIGKKALKIQALFSGYTEEPNKDGYFLSCQDYNLQGNEGVMVCTNCFDDESHFMDTLQIHLLFNL